MILNDKYFSLSSLFKSYLGITLSPKECQFIAKGLKYATDKFNLEPVRKRRDRTLHNNYSNQYDKKLIEYAVSLHLEYRAALKLRHFPLEREIIENLAKDIEIT